MKKRKTLQSGTRRDAGPRQRAPVQKVERVGPTPETLAKLKPWPINRLLADGQLSPDRFETCIEIVEAYRFITRVVGFKPVDIERVAAAHGDIGERGERTFALYRKWGNAVQGIDPGASLLEDVTVANRRRALAAAAGLMYAERPVRPHLIVEMIEDDDALWLSDETALLNAALSAWQRIADEYDRERQAERNAKKERNTIVTEASIMRHYPELQED